VPGIGGIAGIALLTLAGCLEAPDHAGTMYRCTVHPECPDGFQCVGGVCTENTAGGDLVGFGAGMFTMGCMAAAPFCPGDAQVPHTVKLSAFRISASEVTRGEYDACSACPPLSASTDPASFPVRGVPFSAADMYCRMRGMQLPTEAQWERAARGTDDLPFPWNGDIDCAHASYAGCGSAGPEPVTSRAAGDTPEHVHAMAGNVREWVADFYAQPYPSGTVSDPLITSGSLRVIRGGSYKLDASAAAVWHRDSGDPAHQAGDSSLEDVGFRCAD
jgi:sulfatase modifying factor 1